MAESSTKNTINNIAESSTKNTTNIPKESSITNNNGDQSSTKKPINYYEKQPINYSYDFYLELTPTSKEALVTAFSALSDTHFNPTQMGLMNVSGSGFRITVKPELDEHVFGLFYLKASNLINFECQNTVNKVVNLEHLYFLVRDADEYRSTIIIYVLRGSNQLCFEFDHGVRPKIVEVYDDINSEYENMHHFIYGFKSIIPLWELKQMIKDILKIQPRVARPHSVTLYTKSARWRIVTDGGLGMERRRVNHTVRMTWRHWETLEKAASLAEECLVYVEQGKNPDDDDIVVLRLKLQEVGDLYFLQKAYI